MGSTLLVSGHHVSSQQTRCLSESRMLLVALISQETCHKSAVWWGALARARGFWGPKGKVGHLNPKGTESGTDARAAISHFGDCMGWCLGVLTCEHMPIFFFFWSRIFYSNSLLFYNSLPKWLNLPCLVHHSSSNKSLPAEKSSNMLKLHNPI